MDIDIPRLNGRAEYPGGRRASHRAGGSGGNATPVPTIPCVATKSSRSSNTPITWALTRSKVRTKPGSNVDPRGHAPAPLVRTVLEFERFDHVASQTSSGPSRSGRHLGEPRSQARSGLLFLWTRRRLWPPRLAASEPRLGCV